MRMPAMRPSLAREDGRPARIAALSVLFAAEVVLLGARFDAAPLKSSRSALVALLGEEGVIPLATTAAVFLGSARLRGEVRAVAAQLGRARPWLPFLLGHLVAFALFVRLTGAVLEHAGGAPAEVGSWLAAWTAAGFATVVLWSAALLPGRALLGLARPATALLLGAGVVGGVAWVASFVTRAWWEPLGHLTARVVAVLLALVFEDPVLRVAELTLGSREFVIQVAPPCSGYQGIGLIWVFLGTYLWLSRRTLRFPRALLLLPLGTVVVWLANTIRIAALVAVGTWISPEVAMGGFHSSAGVLLFCAISLGFLWAAERSPFFAAEAPPAAEALDGNPAAAYLAPLLAIVATATAAAALSPGGVDVLYPLRVVAAGAARWYFWPRYPDLRWAWSWPALGAGVAAFGLWMALERGAPVDAAAVGLPAGWAAVWLAFKVLGSVVTVPLAEELAFRGYLMRRLVAADFERVPLDRFLWLPFLASSLAFGLMHQRVLAATLAGMVYALVAYRRGRLGDAVLAHATTNALLAGWVLLTGSWSVWV
jgi:exosortase E/protease (VPEID-CTERM system)